VQKAKLRRKPAQQQGDISLAALCKPVRDANLSPQAYGKDSGPNFDPETC
jgi:hypothetical protein